MSKVDYSEVNPADIVIVCDGPFGKLLGLKFKGKEYSTNQILNALQYWENGNE